MLLSYRPMNTTKLETKKYNQNTIIEIFQQYQFCKIFYISSLCTILTVVNDKVIGS